MAIDGRRRCAISAPKNSDGAPLLSRLAIPDERKAPEIAGGFYIK
jgi:hypothetical protein